MMMMSSISFTSGLLLLWLFIIPINNFATVYVTASSYKYDRIEEVNRECGSVLHSATELLPDENRLYTIKEGLSFVNGDWWQDLDGASPAPIMPFDDREIPKTDMRSPLQLVSFWVTDVNTHDRRRSNKSVFVSGLLLMGITLEGLFSEKPISESPRFDIWPGHSQLSVSFQGIYTESNKERVMCLLGSTVLPSRQADASEPWGWVKEYGYTNQPLLAQDEQILLVLRFPRKLTLTSSAIRGSMTSLNKKSNLKYFNEVHVSSRLASSMNYEFTPESETLVSKACDPYPSKDSLLSSEVDLYKGLDFCDILQRFTQQEALTILPNWKCNGTDEFCSKLGPFVSDKEINATDGSFKNVKLVLQDVICGKMTVQDKTGTIRIASIFRAVPPSENHFGAAQRTGLSNMTLSAEGIWKSSSGQLCMAGCTGFTELDANTCDSRICLYIPLSFSVTQRSILFGTLSSTSGSYFPLAFEKMVRPAELWDQYSVSHPYYKYSKMDEAGAVLEKDEPFNFRTIIKKSLLEFPKIEDMEQLPYSLSLLSEDLTLHVPAVPDPLPNSFISKTDVEMEILSIGPLFGRYWSRRNASSFEKEKRYFDEVVYTEKQLLLNVSGQLNLVGHLNTNVTSLYLEGIYDPHVGKMYLIGCRDARASWKTLYESMDLEAGLDCLVSVVIAYPPTSSRWLVNPTASISINSKRNEDDPLYFSTVKLQTIPIMYRKQRDDILSRRGVEGILRMLTLSLAIACIWSQLSYAGNNIESVPYISLVMLGVQAIGYSFPLVTGAEAIFRKGPSDSIENYSYELQKSQWIYVIDYSVKLLVLAAFSLTLMLFHKVWKSRIRMLTRTPLEPHRVPSDKKVFWTTLSIHLIGYILALTFHYVNTSHKPLQTAHFLDAEGYSHAIREWETELEEYLGLVQDLFLFPQVIANMVWMIDCKPLRHWYYAGMTLVRLLPHVYDLLKSSVPNPYFTEEYEFVNPRTDFFSKFGDIAIPSTAVLLALAVYVQQRWNCQKLTEKLFSGRLTYLLPLGSKVYERLPSVSVEAELVSVVNRSSTGDKENDAE